MLGDQCSTHGCAITTCGCEPEPTPCLPNGVGECDKWTEFKCVFWTGAPIEGTPIVKGMRLPAMINYLLNRIVLLEARVTELEP
jgi:hypothetical protein